MHLTDKQPLAHPPPLPSWQSTFTEIPEKETGDVRQTGHRRRETNSRHETDKKHKTDRRHEID